MASRNYTMPRIRAKVQQSEVTHLLNLPPEIRVNEIYKYILPSPRDIKVTVPWNGKLQTQILRTQTYASKAFLSTSNDVPQARWQWTNLLLVNKELHREVATLVYGSMEICLLLSTDLTTRNKVYHCDGPGSVCVDIEGALARLQSMWERRIFAPAGFSNAVDPQSYPTHQFGLMCQEQRDKLQLSTTRFQQRLLSWAEQEQLRMYDHGPLSSSAKPMTLEWARMLYIGRQTMAIMHDRDFHSRGATALPMNPLATPKPLQNAMPLAADTMATFPTIHRESVSSFTDVLSSMEQGYCPCLQNQRRIEELHAGILQTKFLEGKCDPFQREFCTECARSRAQTLQVCYVPYERPVELMFPRPTELWDCPVAHRYRHLVGKVRIVCDGVSQDRYSRYQNASAVARSFRETMIRTGFALEDVVQKLNNSGLRCDIVVDMAFTGKDRAMAWDGAKMVLRPFERYKGSTTPKFNTLVWINQETSSKEEAVIDGTLKEGLTDPASASFAEFLQGWNGALLRKGTAPFPLTISAFSLVYEFVYQLVNPNLLNCGPLDFPRQAHALNRWTSDAREAADQRDLERLGIAWSNIADIAFSDDDGTIQVRKETQRGASAERQPWKFIKDEVRMQKLNGLVWRIDGILGKRETPCNN